MCKIIKFRPLGQHNIKHDEYFDLDAFIKIIEFSKLRHIFCIENVRYNITNIKAKNNKQICFKIKVRQRVIYIKDGFVNKPFCFYSYVDAVRFIERKYKRRNNSEQIYSK